MLRLALPLLLATLVRLEMLPDNPFFAEDTV